jgi:hypothetical protein
MASIVNYFLGYFQSNCILRPIDFADATEVARHDRMVALVEAMLDLHRKLAAAVTGQEKAVLQRQIVATDRQIDRLVYELYGLTEEEIGIVEGFDHGGAK